MLAHEENMLLMQVGPGSPGGELLRRYWQPVCPAAELTTDKPKRRVRLLGEDLVLFRDGRGQYGLIAEHCRHRRASLYFGFVEEDGLRCAYHGWKYDVAGNCIERPFEKASRRIVSAACLKGYPVQALAGILFAYMGPQPAPLLPRWETLVRRDGVREIIVLPLHRCNWLQAQENSVDPVHTYYLHGHMLKVHNLIDPVGAYYYRPIKSYDFSLCQEPTWTGIRKIRVYGGDKPETEIGHPAVFPNILMSPQGDGLVTHWRVPVDDAHTHIIWCEFKPNIDGAPSGQADKDIPVTYWPDGLQENGEYGLTTFAFQDQMAWETQGVMFDRTQEFLGASDRGIVMYRKLLKEQIEAVKAGRDPVGVIRDPAVNSIISFSASSGQARMVRESGDINSNLNH